MYLLSWLYLLHYCYYFFSCSFFYFFIIIFFFKVVGPGIYHMAIIDVLQVISVAFCYLLPHCFLKNIFSEFVSSFLLQQWTYGKRVEKVSCQTFYVDESLSYMLILNRCRLQCFKILSKCYCGFCGRDPNTVWILILASFAFVLWLFPSLTCL